MCGLFRLFMGIFSGGEGKLDKRPLEEKVHEEKERVKTWHDRAQMAYEQRNPELAQAALQRKFEHACELADLEGKPRPERPEEPEETFGSR